MANWEKKLRYKCEALPVDANGDTRYPAEKDWPIKAQCVRCGGKGTVYAGHKSGPGFCFPQHDPCGLCNGRGYYFLPLGD